MVSRPVLWDPTADLLATGAIDLPICERYRLEGVQDVHRALESGETIGEMIIDLRPTPETLP